MLQRILDAARREGRRTPTLRTVVCGGSALHPHLSEAFMDEFGDVLVNDPTVRNTYSRGAGRDEFNIRGFTLFNYDVSFNGLYGVSPRNSSSLIGVERVEVLRGPNALLNGMAPYGSVGGSINLVPKRAGADPLNRFTVSYIGDSQFGAHADLSRRYGDSQEWGVRLNVAGSGGDLPMDGASEDLGAVALGLAWHGRRGLGGTLAEPSPWRSRFVWGALLLSLPWLAFEGVSRDAAELSHNRYVNALSGNGVYEFFAAAYRNELDYPSFYRTLPTEDAYARLRRHHAQRPDLGAGDAGLLLHRAEVRLDRVEHQPEVAQHLRPRFVHGVRRRVGADGGLLAGG